MSINLNRPVPWKEFKTLPASLQEEYVKHLADAYGCNAVGMSMVFGANVSAVRAYFSRHGLSAHSRRGEQMPYESVKALESFINQGKSADCPEGKDEMDLPVEHEPECKEDAPFTPAQQQEGMRMTSFTIRFNGTVDAGMIANSLRHILGDNARGEIEVQCRLEKEGTND